MLKTMLRLLLAGSMAISGCQSPNSNTNNTATSDTAAGSTPPATQSTAEDPDITDTVPAEAYGINTYGKQAAENVKATLTKMYSGDLEKNIIDSISRKFIIFQYDLNGDDAKEIFVGLTGPYFCGTGGCTCLLLDSAGNSITAFTVTDYPLIVAGTKTNGWKDLILSSRGTNHLVKYNGKKYPSNPSVLPAYKETPGDELPRLLDFLNEPYPWFRF
ncbi:hypothetical protein [Foetidibacter luteolus]|uniref:hypothetical protein n=1 Tax=Foetidibacter luteolus TaxID=2608880 RepID=UPI00129A385D|nr:hypothetical protein [Foetidibacter luteolus]